MQQLVVLATVSNPLLAGVAISVKRREVMNSRKLKRNKERSQKKLAKKAMKSVSKALEQMPQRCGECSAVFERGSQESLEWRIAVHDDGRVNLVCSSCVPDDVKDQPEEVG
jgi:hypothetical protein